MTDITRLELSVAVIVASAWGCSGDGQGMPKVRAPDAGEAVALEIPGGTLDDATRWQARHATFEAGRVTFAGKGEGDACELGWIAQTVPLPSRAEARSLVVELDVASSCPLDIAVACPALQLELGDSVTRVGVRGGAPQTIATCLGAAGNADSLMLRIRPAIAMGDTLLRCDLSEWPALDAVRIREAAPDECPNAGGALVPDARWTLMAAAEIKDGSLHLSARGGAVGTMFVPQPGAAPPPALHFTHQTRLPFSIVGLDGLAWFTLAHSDDAQTGFYCLPEWSFGTAHQLMFAALSSDLEISDLRLEPEPRCGDGRFDAGFERPFAAGSWAEYGMVTGGVSVTELPDAPPGEHSLRVSRDATLAALVRVPDRTPERGAAVSFTYRLSDAAVRGSYRTNLVLETRELPADVTDGRIEACVPPAYDGQLVSLILGVTTTSATTASGAWVDDAGPVLVASCR